MRNLTMLSVVLFMFLLLSACTSKEAEHNLNDQPDEVVYYGKGEEWLATFSIFKVNHLLFDSIYIQNIGEDRGAKGPIEYKLVGGDGFKFESQYPQELQGVRSFHTSSESNSDIVSIKPTADGVFELTIEFNGKTENLKLKKMTAR
ncbi:hypothetical protein [Cohnella sp. GbtcB17]|uniref:hypothetical protein n=1 Tax=Cohnella sp. GbtcB17 TaxID=2824762 RepID=UPI001C2F2E96|nr:hypothetical protein [Cohnella sp. GbtcB17]